MPDRVFTVAPASVVRGPIAVPGDKSISHRYVLFGAIADGATRISGLAPGADVAATIACMRALGVRIETPGGTVLIHGRGRSSLTPPTGSLDAQNSGTTLRLLAGILAGCPFATTIGGDASLQRRPMQRIIDPLTAMGARIDASNGDKAPLTIRGGALHAIDWRSPVASAQVKSCVLLAGLAATGRTSVQEPQRTRDHTERALPAFGGVVAVDGLTVSADGGQRLQAPQAELDVPGDPSSAAVWAAAAAALPGSDVRIDGVCLNPLRLGFVDALQRLGARIDVQQTSEVGGEPVGSLRVRHHDHACTAIDRDQVPSLIDELPVLAARAALGGELAVSGAGELRVKESDRIHALVTGFQQLGIEATEQTDGFVIRGHRQPAGGEVDAAGDHRLVMAFTIVGLGARGPVTIHGAEAVAVSYPGFSDDLARLRA